MGEWKSLADLPESPGREVAENGLGLAEMEDLLVILNVLPEKESDFFVVFPDQVVERSNEIARKDLVVPKNTQTLSFQVDFQGLSMEPTQGSELVFRQLVLEVVFVELGENVRLLEGGGSFEA